MKMKRFKNYLTDHLRRGGAFLALGAMSLFLFARASEARAQDGATYHLVYRTDDASLITNPNPFPPFVSVRQGGQITIKVDSLPHIADTFVLRYTEFHPSFGGDGIIFLDVPTAPRSPANMESLLQDTLITTIYQTFSLTFRDIGTYTLSVGIDSSKLTTFKVVVLPANAGGATFAGFWDASIFYPPNSIVA